MATTTAKKITKEKGAEYLKLFNRAKIVSFIQKIIKFNQTKEATSLPIIDDPKDTITIAYLHFNKKIRIVNDYNEYADYDFSEFINYALLYKKITDANALEFSLSTELIEK